MPLDIMTLPLVRMSHEEDPDHDHGEDFEALEARLERGAPFVILTDNAPIEDPAHSQDEKKPTALWMKRHKAELPSLVRAMIVIGPSAAKRLELKSFGVAFAKFWGCPLRLATSREEAMEIAGTLLPARAGSARPDKRPRGRHRAPAGPGLVFAECRRADPVFPSGIGRRDPGLLLLRHPDDRLFADP